MTICGFTQASLARAVGIKQPSINRLLQGDVQNPRFLHDIARELKTSTAYLLGETDNPDGDGVSDRRLPFRGAEPEPRADTLAIREIDLTLGFGASYLDVPVTEVVHEFPRSWIRHYTRAPADQLMFAQGVGDSMVPTLADSDQLLIDCSQKTLTMADKIWAVAYADCGMVKRLRPLPGGGVALLSDNPNVPDIVAHDGEMHILGRVVAVMRKI